jgi:two-component system, cell cycle sensor histidine kinase and response regulator CckA
MDLNEITSIEQLLADSNISPELKKDIKKHQRYSRRFKHIADNVDEAVVVTNQEGIITHANTSAKQMYGSENLLKKSIYILLSDKNDTVSLEESCQAIKEGDKWRGELLVTRLNNTECPVEVSISSFKNSKGELKTMYLATDISRRKELEKRLEAQQKATEGLVHDTRNLATVIIGYAEMILAPKQNTNNSTIKNHTKIIFSTGTRIKNYLTDILDFSKSKLHTPKPININDLVEKSSKMIIQTDKYRTITSFESSSYIMGDERNLNRVLDNLLINATESLNGEGTIALFTQDVYLEEEFQKKITIPPGAYVKIDIIDTGCGIPEKIIEKIFEHRYTTKSNGSGIGLATVKNIIENHDGYMDVTSDTHGTTFSVYLPIIPSVD